ncbi:hypothetical protein [Crucian carp herpesvirus]|uniref:ORF77 n=1 Tax=Cyprinid herpesvirus 2 TaxID=317878 RepID=K7PCC5_CYHV2|nr:protein ORF77 [Cyprinid herpesvirus 2]APB92924.1 hypothetical protein [Crucian carp herpesvirus]AFJ20507.1 protein ORF77 [Cyprinid herpesvirus 2]AKC02023.1 hypothetical protein [Cyprinid herpesvirus 2]AMB21646.1 ORF77 [Cyprinid herpesvirus 2]QAU54799.1 protein ORF77 [Cyprinid herpesvirus 2]
MGAYVSIPSTTSSAAATTSPPPMQQQQQQQQKTAADSQHQRNAAATGVKLFSVCGTQWPRTLFDAEHFHSDKCYRVEYEHGREFGYAVYEMPKCTVAANPRDTIDFVNRTTQELVAQMDKGIISTEEMQLLIEINTQYRNKMWAGDSSRMVSPLTYGSQHVIYGVSHLCGSLLRKLSGLRFFVYDPKSQSLTVRLVVKEDEDANGHHHRQQQTPRTHHTHRRSELVLDTRGGGYGPASSKSTSHRSTPY